ncbi:hypothetical protein EC973_007643 [Apophysomyces ossiformis]|uniref:Heterokaryon incompatibility domain-containing protein n=1 Tax=Apophysomyces ossiformis TaxID=679940 RepID=A0A8H7EQS8_9FUNG|nr:hypothetical protein EC973_007643 [Apophysomyces ossiformis]
MSDFYGIDIWEATDKDVPHEVALLRDQFKSNIAFVHKDYDVICLEGDFLIECGLGEEECEYQESFEKSRERHCGILHENVHEKLCENICEDFRELRAISYHWGGSSMSRRDRIESEIVLLDTRSEMNAIQCISIPFDENVLAYYAISYRWGHHPEWKAQTPNYVASITSISQGNLIKLCRHYRDRIRYMWIDVICINQSDRAHRKMAIKNMSNIYERAKRIIGVPDLRYCKDNPFMEDVSREDIEAAIITMSGDWLTNENNIDMLLDRKEPGMYHGFRLDISEWPKEIKPWNEGNKGYSRLDDDIRTKQRRGNRHIGAAYVQWVILEWANRVWVVSERVIGHEGGKLLIHILRTNTVVYYEILATHIPDITWSFDFAEDAFHVILNCDSDKYIDRLYAILPHTDYKYAMEKLVDEDITVNDEDDLQWLLFDILDTADRIDFLQFLKERGEFSIALPLPFSEKDSEEESSGWSGEIVESVDFFKIETITANGNRVLKVSCPFIYPYRSDNDNESQPSDAADVPDMLLLHEVCNSRYRGWRYRRSGKKELWEFVERTKVESSLMWQYGEFLMFLDPEDAFLGSP